jgi:hypothetical protein
MQFTDKALQDLANDPANAEQVRQSQELMHSIVKRSSTDVAFRQQLLTSPKSAIAQQSRDVFGRELTEADIAIDVRFIEPVGEMTIVLPAEIDPAAELTEDELSAVAGGSLLLVASYAAGVAVSLGVVWAVKELTS